MFSHLIEYFNGSQLVIKHRNMPALACKEPGMQENGQNKFHTIVSFFVGNPVSTPQYNVLVYFTMYAYCIAWQALCIHYPFPIPHSPF